MLLFHAVPVCVAVVPVVVSFHIRARGPESLSSSIRLFLVAGTAVSYVSHCIVVDEHYMFYGPVRVSISPTSSASISLLLFIARLVRRLLTIRCLVWNMWLCRKWYWCSWIWLRRLPCQFWIGRWFCRNLDRWNCWILDEIHHIHLVLKRCKLLLEVIVCQGDLSYLLL